MRDHRGPRDQYSALPPHDQQNRRAQQDDRHVIRKRQAGDERACDEPRRSGRLLLPPHERVDDDRSKQIVERKRFCLERPAPDERHRHDEERGDSRCDAIARQPRHRQTDDADRGRVAQHGDEIHPKRRGTDRQPAQHVADHRQQRIAGCVRHPERQRRGDEIRRVADDDVTRGGEDVEDACEYGDGRGDQVRGRIGRRR
jgi:hypothetical protein